MVRMQDCVRGLGLRNVAIGVGLVVLAPVAASVLASVGKPLLKSAIKGGVLAYNKVRVATAEAREVVEDMVAEAQAELAGEQTAPAEGEGGGAAAPKEA